MLSAIRKLFRTRGSTEQRNLQPDCEAPDEEEQSEDKKSIKWKKQQQKASNKQRRQLVTRIYESGGTGRPPTNSSGSTGEHCDSQGGGTGMKCGGGVSFGDCNKIGSNNTESSSSSSTTTNCSSSTGTDNSNSNDSGTSSSNSRNSYHSTGPVNQEVAESGDKQQQQQQQQQQEQLKQLELQTQIAEDYEEEYDEYDDNFEEDFNDELEDGPVAFIAEAPPKQQYHYQKQQLKQQQEQKKSANNQSPSKPFLAGQLKKSTPQTLTSHQHHHSSKTDVDQLLTGSVSQQYRKDAVRGNLEELRAAESINYRSVVYEYSFRVKDTPSNMRVFTDPGDRRIEAIARSCGTQIQLERPKASSHYYEMRARRVTVQAPDLHSLEKCCRQFDDRFPHFYVCGGLGLSSKSIKRVYVDEFNGQPVQ